MKLSRESGQTVNPKTKSEGPAQRRGSENGLQLPPFPQTLSSCYETTPLSRIEFPIQLAEFAKKHTGRKRHLYSFRLQFGIGTHTKLSSLPREGEGEGGREREREREERERGFCHYLNFRLRKFLPHAYPTGSYAIFTGKLCLSVTLYNSIVEAFFSPTFLLVTAGRNLPALAILHVELLQQIIGIVLWRDEKCQRTSIKPLVFMLVRKLKTDHNHLTIKTFMAITAERDAAIRERNMALEERKRAFAERDMAMLQRDAAIAERNAAIQERDEAIASLQFREGSMNDNSTIPDSLGNELESGAKRIHSSIKFVHLKLNIVQEEV
ncbi:hypothetical protein Sango_1854300 [Sesamum angolense]|uniref:GAGA-binding transcriptional activator n=1 Tax=Sesamum angolense TaxID=2727404 RepID=A0AAE1WI51_9LAMI|nr:hypothetical protein Sango_1854300 [Sesamum angolense]